MNLFDYQDLKYQAFHKKLLNNDSIKLIGIRTPILKELAKSLVNTSYDKYLIPNHNYYEEIMIHGLILGYIKIPFKELLANLDIFIPLVDNWAINDTVCANLKAFKYNQEEGYKYIKTLLKINKEFTIRFGLVLLLDYYVNDKYIDKVLEICLNTKSNYYYVNMANAWLISKCYIKFKDKTFILLKNNNLDIWIKNKAISKICDSYCVDKEDKTKIKALRN